MVKAPLKEGPLFFVGKGALTPTPVEVYVIIKGSDPTS